MNEKLGDTRDGEPNSLDDSTWVEDSRDLIQTQVKRFKNIQKSCRQLPVSTISKFK